MGWRWVSNWNDAQLSVCLASIISFAITILYSNSPSRAETQLIPAVNASERYDSNVWYGPPSYVPQGQQRWDLVSTVGGSVQLLNKSRGGDTSITAGADASVFAYNTGLSYVGTYLTGSSDLSGWTNELLPGLGLRVLDNLSYTPQTPSFLAAGSANNTTDVFFRGIQAARANTFTNVFSAQSGYSFSRALSYGIDFGYYTYRVGNIFSVTPEQLGVAFFNTTLYSITTGPQYQFGGGDKLSLLYSYTTGESSQSGGGSTFNYTYQTLESRYVSKLIVPGYTLSIAGGATVIDSSVGGEGSGTQTFFSGRLSLQKVYDQRTTVEMSLSRRATPASFGSGGAVISNVAQILANHRLSKVLGMILTGNYAYNVSSPVGIFTYKGLVATAALEYKLTRSTFLLLSQEYDRFSYTNVPTFDRYATMLTLRHEWR